MLKQKIADDLKEAMRAGDELRRSVLRMLISSIQNKEIELQKKDTGLADEEVLQVIRSEVKKRKDAAAEFKAAAREEMATRELEEGKLLEQYLPPEISDEELLRIVEKGVEETGATSVAEFGTIMKAVMPSLKGRASGDRISAAVREVLGRKAQ